MFLFGKGKNNQMLKTIGDFVRARDKVCVKCGSTDRTEIDHIFPSGLNGALWDKANLQLLCHACHVEKTTSDRAKIRAARLEIRKKIHLEFHPECINYPIHSEICSKNAKIRAKRLNR
jgi:5-methylcytosine-specific restriction endonuclease McrA